MCVDSLIICPYPNIIKMQLCHYCSRDYNLEFVNCYHQAKWMNRGKSLIDIQYQIFEQQCMPVKEITSESYARNFDIFDISNFRYQHFD